MYDNLYFARVKPVSGPRDVFERPAYVTEVFDDVMQTVPTVLHVVIHAECVADALHCFPVWLQPQKSVEVYVLRRFEYLYMHV